LFELRTRLLASTAKLVNIKFINPCRGNKNNKARDSSACSLPCEESSTDLHMHIITSMLGSVYLSLASMSLLDSKPREKSSARIKIFNQLRLREVSTCRGARLAWRYARSKNALRFARDEINKCRFPFSLIREMSNVALTIFPRSTVTKCVGIGGRIDSGFFWLRVSTTLRLRRQAKYIGHHRKRNIALRPVPMPFEWKSILARLR